MRIVSVSYNYSPQFINTETWFKRAAQYHGILDMLAETNTVISVKQIGFTGTVVHNKVEHRFTDFGKNQQVFAYRMNRLIKSLKPDVVLLQGLHHSLEFMHLFSLLPRHVKIIAQHHAEKPSKTLRKYVQRLTDKYIDAYLFASVNLGRQWVDARIISNPGKIHEVMELSSLFRPVKKSEALSVTKAIGQPMFLWVGRLNPNKDPLTVLRSFLRYADKQPAAKLYMIYQTEELLPELIALLDSHPNKNAVILVGKVDNDDLLYWNNSADFLLSGSHYEGGGAAVCEAISCGCIPVVTDIAPFRMTTNNGDCGVLYEAGNENALADALLKTQTLDVEKYRQKCLDWFEQKLSFKAIARDIEAVANLIIK